MQLLFHLFLNVASLLYRRICSDLLQNYLLIYIVECLLVYLGESFPKLVLTISVSAFKCRIMIFYV